MSRSTHAEAPEPRELPRGLQPLRPDRYTLRPGEGRCGCGATALFIAFTGREAELLCGGSKCRPGRFS